MIYEAYFSSCVTCKSRKKIKCSYFAVGAVGSRLVRKLFPVLKLELKFPFPIGLHSQYHGSQSCLVYGHQVCTAAPQSVSVPFFPSSDDGDDEGSSAVGRNIFALSVGPDTAFKDDFCRSNLVP